MAWGTNMITRITGALLLLGAAFTVGCGGDEPVKEPYKEEPSTSVADSVKAKRKAKKGLLEFKAKPEWDMMSPHFQKFVTGIREGLDSKSVTWNYKDAFADHTEKFYPSEDETKKSFLGISKMKTEAKKKDEKKDPTLSSILSGMVPPENADSLTGDGTDALEEPDTNPLTLYPLNKYVFKILMTGVANPEALVSDPDGFTHVLHLNDKIGLEGGYITDILKHKVLIRVPDQDIPLEVSLAPASLPDSFAMTNK